jgi:hypothetical protein
LSSIYLRCEGRCGLGWGAALSTFAAAAPGEFAVPYDIAAFRAVDERLRELSVRYIRSKVCGNIPSKEEIGKKDGYAVLKHQLALQRRHKPVRQLAAEMGDAFTRLAPCLLMSPLSVAQYLPADQALFDLVIFDEASQIAPWDAIGAMARGKQVVIAGDPRQMPPTSFFTRAASATEGDADTEADTESILDECLASGVPAHTLSRHESLIAFSNHRYYDSGLITPPAPVTRDPRTPASASRRRLRCRQRPQRRGPAGATTAGDRTQVVGPGPPASGFPRVRPPSDAPPVAGRDAPPRRTTAHRVRPADLRPYR